MAMGSTMDSQFLLNIIGVTAATVGGWFAVEIWSSVKGLRDDLHRLEVELPQNYVSKLDMDKRMDNIEAMIQRIYDKLDAKADKH